MREQIVNTFGWTCVGCGYSETVPWNTPISMGHVCPAPEELERRYELDKKEWEAEQRAEAAASWARYQEIEWRVRSAFA